jgi:hypothetical protein
MFRLLRFLRFQVFGKDERATTFLISRLYLPQSMVERETVLRLGAGLVQPDDCHLPIDVLRSATREPRTAFLTVVFDASQLDTHVVEPRQTVSPKGDPAVAGYPGLRTVFAVILVPELCGYNPMLGGVGLALSVFRFQSVDLASVLGSTRLDKPLGLLAVTNPWTYSQVKIPQPIGP